jgi:hypothetical protein
MREMQQWNLIHSTVHAVAFLPQLQMQLTHLQVGSRRSGPRVSPKAALTHLRVFMEC